MVNLRAIPYNLNDEDIAWVEQTIAAMTENAKVGRRYTGLKLRLQGKVSC